MKKSERNTFLGTNIVYSRISAARNYNTKKIRTDMDTGNTYIDNQKDTHYFGNKLYPLRWKN